MEDSTIVEMYKKRDEGAISETRSKYGNYLYKIACNILSNNEDSEECVNDTYYKAWETIPPHEPVKLSVYLATITRNIAISLFRHKKREIRGGTQYEISLDELGECVSGGETPEELAESGMVGRYVSDYLRTLSANVRIMFVCRYFYNDSISDIAGYFGASESKVKSALFRARKGLKEYLISNGVDV